MSFRGCGMAFEARSVNTYPLFYFIEFAVDELFATYDQYFEAELTRARKKDRDGKELGPAANDVAMYRVLYSGQDHDKDPFAKRIARSARQAEEFYRDRLK